jgi:hypothetical protein
MRIDAADEITKLCVQDSSTTKLLENNVVITPELYVEHGSN